MHLFQKINSNNIMILKKIQVLGHIKLNSIIQKIILFQGQNQLIILILIQGLENTKLTEEFQNKKIKEI